MKTCQPWRSDSRISPTGARCSRMPSARRAYPNDISAARIAGAEDHGDPRYLRAPDRRTLFRLIATGHHRHRGNERFRPGTVWNSQQPPQRIAPSGNVATKPAAGRGLSRKGRCRRLPKGRCRDTRAAFSRRQPAHHARRHRPEVVEHDAQRRDHHGLRHRQRRVRAGAHNAERIGEDEQRYQRVRDLDGSERSRWGRLGVSWRSGDHGHVPSSPCKHGQAGVAG